VNVKHYNKITDIEFSPLAPYDFAVTSSTRVQIYDSNTCSVKKSLSRFPDVAYSGSYRGSDGKVLVAGCEDSKIRVYDLSSRVVLRTLVGHTAPVKTVRFLSEQRFLLSGSDDHSVRTWDMTTEQNLDVLRGHTDYVRSVVEHTDFNPFCFLSAAYDHTVRYWDRRLSNAQGQACVFTLNHGAPIEDLLVLPNHGQGDLLATAGENTVKIWNIRMASNSAAAASAAAASSSQRGALLHRSSNHQKTVLSLTYDHSTDRMLSGGLDHMVKIYDMRPSLTGGALDSSTPRSSLATEFMSVTHSMKFAAPILSTAISPDSRVLVVGMADGSLSMRTRDISGVNKAASFLPPKNLAESLREDVAYSTPLPPARSEPRPGSRRFFGRGASFEPGKGLPSADDDAEATGEDLKIARVRRQRLAPYDVLLKGFKYHAALDAALATNRPTIVLSMLDELINRNGLVHALANRDAHALLPLMHFASKYLAHPAYAATLVDLVNLVLDLYAPLLGLVVEFDALLYRLAQRVLKPELENQKALIALQAVLSNVTARSALRQRQLDQAEPEEEEEEQPMQQQDTDERMHDTAAAAGEEEEEQQEGEEDEQPAAAAEEEEEEEEEAEEEEPTPAQTKSSSKPSKRKQPPTVTSAADLDAEEAVEEEEDAEQPGSPPPKGKNKKKDKENKQVQEEEEDEPAPAEEEEEEEEQPQTKAKKHKKAHKDAAASPALAPANGKPAKKQKV
jgi:U3 small nucleolar RNA-associated protein 15